MSKLQLVRIILNAAVVFVGALSIGDLFPPEHALKATTVLGALSLSLRAVMAELPNSSKSSNG